MERYYGVITSIDPSTSTYSEAYAKKTANEFLNKLYKATKVVDSPYTYNPINILSNYSYLNNNGDNSQNRLIDNFYSGGVYAETRTPEGEVAILVDKTTGMSGANITNTDELSVVAVARFSDRLYLVVRPPLPSGDTIDGWTRSICDIRIEHHYPYTVTPEPEEDEDPPAPEPVTVDHKTVFHLGSNNSNGNAPAVAYEITATQSKDTLVKLAWCPADTPSSERELKSHFTQWDICCYGSKIEGGTGARTLAIINGKSHSAEDFGAAGPIGGFVIHKMKNGSYKHGITVFNADGSPFYTWSDNARPWDEFDSTGEIPRNVNHGGIGRLISKKTVSEDSEETVVKMAVLAPIFCPAANDQADTAKWMPQGLYDYSYFDKTGHIYLKKSDDMADSTPVFFADHGVYLFDGGLSSYQLTDRSLPESYAINTSVVERPQAPSWLPGYSRFYAIFDCEDGLSSSGWLNTLDDSIYDMRFVGGAPTINSDGSATFINSPSGCNSAWCPSVYGAAAPGSNNGCITIVAFKTSLSQWSDKGDSRELDTWLPFMFGHIPGDDIKNSVGAMAERTFGVSQDVRFDDAISGNHWTAAHGGSGGREYAYRPLASSSWYILVISHSGFGGSNSPTISYYLYKINDDGTYTSLGSYYEYSDGYFSSPRTMRFYLGSHCVTDSWRGDAVQIGKRREYWGATNFSWQRASSAPGVSFQTKFVALADASGSSWRYLSNSSNIISAIAQHYAST